MSLAEEQLSTFATTEGFDPEMVLSHAEPLAHPKIGERAKAQDADGGWYAGRIVEARDEKFKIHFIGYEDDEDVWVAPDDLNRSSQSNMPSGRRWKCAGRRSGIQRRSCK